MSFLQPTGSQWRTPEYGKSVVVSSWRGVTRVQAWPKKRGKPKNRDQADRQEIFRVFQRVIKALHHREVEHERQAIVRHNKSHRGQRGSAAIRFRDWQTKRLYGRGVAVTSPIGITFYPAAVSRDASFILDHTTARPGQVLQRSTVTWEQIDQGSPGDVLYSQGNTLPNVWAAPY